MSEDEAPDEERAEGGDEEGTAGDEPEEETSNEAVDGTEEASEAEDVEEDTAADEDENDDDDSGTDSDDEPGLSEEELHEALDDAEGMLEEAETEADLDEVEATIEAIEVDLGAAELPEPDEEDEDAEDPREELESRIEELRSELEDQRGPYTEDVVEAIESEVDTVEEEEWTDDGLEEATAAVEAFLTAIDDLLSDDVADSVDEDVDALTAALERAIAAVEAGDLDPDADSETIAALLEATDDLESDLDDAEVWLDLSVRERMQRQGFYDVLSHYKDYPPEWSALKEHEKRGNADMVLLAFEMFDSDFMEEHCLSALKRMGDERAVEPMMELAQKRNKPAIEILGKVASDEPVEMLREYAAAEKDPQLQYVTLKALGEIGSEEGTQAVADQLVAESYEVRSRAARALGLIGDTRAVDPLSTVLADDESDVVRASAAWALNQIGTESALSVVREYAEDRAYIVQSEAKKAETATAGV
ncbi:HEAT repeat domain-containing protein [Natronorarus salvus]|uniref:HEAT repeat domain-containing protein n=1 Tax=Natronorarus salvus TaxID=3117733 RepID=UPI002F265BCA